LLKYVKRVCIVYKFTTLAVNKNNHKMNLFPWANKAKLNEPINDMGQQELRRHIAKLKAVGQTQAWFLKRVKEICERNWDELPTELQVFLKSGDNE